MVCMGQRTLRDEIIIQASCRVLFPRCPLQTTLSECLPVCEEEVDVAGGREAPAVAAAHRRLVLGAQPAGVQFND